MRKLERIDPSDLASNPRASLAAWLKYQALVIAAYRTHPRPYRFKPTNMSPTTVASRLRDAIRGCLAFGYPSPIDGRALAKWYAEIVIQHNHEEVIITPPKKNLDPNLQGDAPTRDDLYKFDSLNFDELMAFALLLSRNRIQGPIIVKTPPDMTMFPEHLNVTRFEKDGNLVLL